MVVLLGGNLWRRVNFSRLVVQKDVKSWVSRRRISCARSKTDAEVIPARYAKKVKAALLNQSDSKDPSPYVPGR